MKLLPQIQDNLDIKIDCKSIGNAVIRKATITESISDLFCADVFIQTTEDINIENVINTAATVSIKYEDSIRYFSGIIEVATFENVVSTNDKFSDSILYIRIVPSIAKLSYSTKFRSFQDTSVKGILSNVLKESNISNFKILLNSNGLTNKDFCVQYGESDLHFVSRIMEESGIFYYFEHHPQNEQLIISDTSISSPKIKRQLNVMKLYSDATISPTLAYNVSLTKLLGSKKINTNFFDAEKGEVINGSYNDNSKKNLIGENEIYNNIFSDKAEGDKISKTTLESLNSCLTQLKASTFCPELFPGSRFTLSGSKTTSHNGEFFVTFVKHTINQIPDTENPPHKYTNSIVAIPSDIPYRPTVRHFKNRIYGSQTATVTGVSGEEIFCDENARIKVKFHWDSRSKKNETSSCWIRVAQNLAGSKFGGLVIPRIGMEVLVTFLDGDPDQPIVTGCVYNGLQKPPADYTKKKTISTFHTKSLNDKNNGFNELRFDDKKDSEEIYIHAQKDLNKVIENNITETLNVGSKKVTLEGTDTLTENLLLIKHGNDKVTISEGDQLISLNKGNRTITLKQGNQSVTLSEGNLTIDVKGEISINASKDINITSNANINIKSQKDTLIDAQSNLNINAQNNVSIMAAQYTSKVKTSYKIESTTYNLRTTAAINISGQIIDIKSNTALNIDALAAVLKAKATINLTGTAGVTVSGATVALG
ncbi:MAG: type VI secretion system tip protein VgrG [Alphaproteobacteria bacterium]|nr:type VI secretion system tip protein VgrG [Alphaproteobacteria bacterium]